MCCYYMLVGDEPYFVTVIVTKFSDFGGLDQSLFGQDGTNPYKLKVYGRL